MVSIDICIHRWDRKTQEHARAFEVTYIAHKFLPISKGYFYLLSSYILKSLFDTENNKPKIA